MDQLSLGMTSASGNTHFPNANGGLVQCPELVHRSETTAVYQQEDVGIKVILGSAPAEEKTLQLQHEKNISNFLPSSCNKKEVFCIQNFNGSPAMYFKWCHGVTLKQWLQNAKASVGKKVDLNVRLRAAVAIAKTLHEFHKGGVIYNNLLPENIVLDTLGENYVATFVDLSKAIFIDNEHMGSNQELATAIKGNDLHDLGNILNELFLGGNENVDSESLDGENILSTNFCLPTNEDNPRRKRGKQQVVGEIMPLYLAAMISSLRLNGALKTLPPNLCYSNALDVFLDLKVAVESSGRLLERCELDDPTATGCLRLRNDLFHGRQVQISMLMQLYETMVVSGHQMMAVLSGGPGTGKSAIVNQIRKRVEKNGFFIEGKFSKSSRADMVLVSALDSFFGDILNSGKPNMQITLRWRIHDKIGSGNCPLMGIMPNLKSLVVGNAAENSTEAENRSSTGSGLVCSSQRLKVLICKLIGAIGCAAKPLIFFLDDLQWADAMTLDILRLMMVDPDISHTLLLGCYRDNEIKTTDPLILTMNEIQEQGNNVVKVKVGLIEKDSVNSLVSEVLSLPPSLCKSLSTIVHSKTGGIVLFVLKFLTSLSEEGYLWFSQTSRRWEFNLDAISSKIISEDVVQYMTKRMACLSKQMQMGLKIAACLGTRFQKEAMILAGKDSEFCMGSVVDSCVDGGFLNEIGNSVCTWAHDQVQQAAYDLIPDSKKESFHLLVGTRLFMSSSSSDIDNFVFFIVDNMNRGLKLIEGSEQRYDVSQLNLRAGEKAMTSSAFHSAVQYLMIGRELLEHDSWETKYSLTMRIYEKLTEALFVIGDFSGMMGLIDKPLAHARSFEDKLNAYDNLVRSLAASGQVLEGIAKCLFVLQELGEEIPEIVTGEVYQDEVNQVKQLMDGKSHEELLALPVMTDTKKLSAMKFMNHALSLTFAAKPALNPILVFRMVKISVAYGVCNLSSFAFGCYGAWLVSDQCLDFDGGYQMSRVAIDIMKRLDAVDIVPRLYVVLYSFINIWKEPFQASLNKFIEAYDIGSSTGDTEYGLSNLLQHSQMAFFGSGENLGGLVQNMKSYLKQAIQHKQFMVAKTLVTLVQLAHELMGAQENAYALYFGGINETSFFALAQENNEKSICRFIIMKRKYAAFWSGDLDTAASMYELSKQYNDSMTGRHIVRVIGTFIDGMIALYFARKHRTEEDKWKRVAESIIDTVKQWSFLSSWNFENKFHLLEAEYYFLKGEDSNAISSYEASIKAAKNHKFLHEEGLAYEKAATFFLHKSKHEQALQYFVEAKHCYHSWGANALVNRMERTISVLLPMLGV